ncbi:hypothetical protein BX616_007080 [Lobosporangium transversale]|nr:hypothetical protein BX616_007080 [Lobosporangium transversale]
MRTTTSGRPFAKDMFDFFSTLMLSLPIENNKIRFKNYPNSFWAEKAVTNLGDLQFIKSSRDADPNDPTRIITHVVRTHFSFTRDMAKNLCQAFMDAYLFESATDSSKREFQNKGLCHITPKGAHLLAKFIYRNKLPPEESRHITANATTSLLYLGRADDEDRLLLTKEHVESIFKRFAGSEPSMRKRNASGIPNANPAVSSANGHDQAPPDDNICHGVDVRDQQYKEVVYKDMFFGKAAVEWLLEHTTVISKEEAICICQEMVAAGYIEQVGKEFSTGPSLFKACGSALYHFTRIGRALAGWGGTEDGNSVHNDWMDERDTVGPKLEHKNPEANLLSVQFNLMSNDLAHLPISITRLQRRSIDENSQSSFQNSDEAPSMSEGSEGIVGPCSARRLSQILGDSAFQATFSESNSSRSSYASSSSGREPVGVSTRRSIRLLPSTGTSQLTSNTSRLYGIMSDATVRDLFNSFLKQHFCEENLSFYLDVLDYKTKFRVLIDSAEAYGQLASEQEPSQSHPPSLRALEKQICTQAFSIYETYLAPGAAREVNLPHQMRQDITAYMQAVVRNMGMSDVRNNDGISNGDSSSGIKAAPESASTPISGSMPTPTPGSASAPTLTLTPTLESAPAPTPTPSSLSSLPTLTEASQSSKVKSQELIHIALFDIIHDHIFRLMSTDSVPKFIKTDKYLAVVMKKHKQRKNTTNTIHPNMVASLSAASQSIHEEVGPTDDTSNSNNSGGNEQYSCTLPTPESSCNEDESRVTETF